MAADRWTVTFSTARWGLCGAAARPGCTKCNSPYQRPVYQSLLCGFDVPIKGLNYNKSKRRSNLSYVANVGEPVLKKLFKVSHSSRLVAQLSSQNVDLVARRRRHRRRRELMGRRRYLGSAVRQHPLAGHRRVCGRGRFDAVGTWTSSMPHRVVAVPLSQLATSRFVLQYSSNLGMFFPLAYKKWWVRKITAGRNRLLLRREPLLIRIFRDTVYLIPVHIYMIICLNVCNTLLLVLSWIMINAVNCRRLRTTVKKYDWII